MKKIAIVLYYYHPYKSGLSEYAKDIAEHLKKDGNYEVDVFTTQYDKTLPLNDEINNLKIYRHKVLFSVSKWVFSPGLIFNIIKIQKEYEKIMFFLPFTESGLVRFLIKKNKLISFYVCDIRVGKSIIAKTIEFFLYKSMSLLLKVSTHIVPLSKDYFVNSRIYIDSFEKKTFPLRPFVSLKNDLKTNIDYRKKFNIGENTFVIGFLGRIVYEKGINYLIETIPYLEKKGMKNFKILIGGDYQNVRGGSVINELKSLIEKYEDKIIVTGFIPEEEKGNFFKTLDVFVLPSIDPLEAFGIVQIESMRYGIPVIASSLPGVREIVQKTKFGLLAEPKNSEDIAEKIFNLYNHKEDFHQYKDNYKIVYDEKKWKQELLDIMK